MTNNLGTMTVFETLTFTDERFTSYVRMESSSTSSITREGRVELFIQIPTDITINELGELPVGSERLADAREEIENLSAMNLEVIARIPDAIRISLIDEESLEFVDQEVGQFAIINVDTFGIDSFIRSHSGADIAIASTNWARGNTEFIKD